MNELYLVAAVILIQVLTRKMNTTSARLERLKQKKSGHNRKDKLENKGRVANEAGTRAESEGKY